MFNKITITLLVILSLSLGGGYLLYSNKQSQLEAEVARNAILESVVEENAATLEKVQDHNRKQLSRLTTLQTELMDAESYNRELRRILQDHDLTMLAEEKPGLIERRINAGTKEVFDSIESFTRSR